MFLLLRFWFSPKLFHDVEKMEIWGKKNIQVKFLKALS